MPALGDELKSRTVAHFEGVKARKLRQLHVFEAGSIAPAPAVGGRRLSFNSLEKEIKELRRQQGAQVLAGCEQGASIG